MLAKNAPTFGELLRPRHLACLSKRGERGQWLRRDAVAFAEAPMRLPIAGVAPC